MVTGGWEGFTLLNKATRDDNSRALEKLLTAALIRLQKHNTHYSDCKTQKTQHSCSAKITSELSILCLYTEYAYRAQGNQQVLEVKLLITGVKFI